MSVRDERRGNEDGGLLTGEDVCDGQVEMVVDVAVVKVLVKEVAHRAQIVDALLEEEAVDEAACPDLVWLYLRQFTPEAL